METLNQRPKPEDLAKDKEELKFLNEEHNRIAAELAKVVKPNPSDEDNAAYEKLATELGKNLGKIAELEKKIGKQPASKKTEVIKKPDILKDQHGTQKGPNIILDKNEKPYKKDSSDEESKEKKEIIPDNTSIFGRNRSSTLEKEKPKKAAKESPFMQGVSSSDVLEYLNKARQDSKEYEGVYKHIMDKGAMGGDFSSLLKKRPDLKEKFAVGKNGEPYSSTGTAAHDLIEYLAKEAETIKKTEEKEKKAKEKLEKEKAEREKIEQEIKSQKDLLDLLNKTRQESKEQNLYWHVFGKELGSNKAEYPDYLIDRPDLIEKFKVGKNGEPYKNTRDAAHDLIEYLANEAEKKISGKSQKGPEDGAKKEKKNKKGQTEEKPKENTEEKKEEEIAIPPTPDNTNGKNQEDKKRDENIDQNGKDILEKVPDRLLAVDVSDIAEQLARQRATERLNIILNKKGLSQFLSKWWHRTAEEHYRQRFIREELARIQGDKNVFANPERKAEHDAEMVAELARFQEDLWSKHGGENKTTLEDPEFNASITKLIRDYATTGMSDEDFDKQKDLLLGKIREKYPDSFGPGKLSTDNFLEAGREFKKVAEHVEGLARLDAGLKVDLGIAKRVVKTDANLRFVDKFIAGTQKYIPLALLSSPAAVSIAVGIGASTIKWFSNKPAYALGGAFGAGAFAGGMRRAKDLKVDVATHRMERAMGRQMADYGADDSRSANQRKNREKMEEYTYNTRQASSIKETLSGLIAEAKSGNPDALKKLTKEVADAEARMSLGETEKIDLIEYEGERVLSQSRLELMRIIAEAKVNITDKEGLTKEIISQMKTLSEDVKGKNWEFTKYRIGESVTAGVKGGFIGLGFGALMQEGLDYIGIHPPHGNETMLNHGRDNIVKLWHTLRGESTSTQVPTNLSECYVPSDNVSVQVPKGTGLYENVAGVFSLVDKKIHEILTNNIIFGKDGSIIHHEITKPGISLETHPTRITASSVHEYLQAQRHTYADKLQEIHRHAHLENNTERPDLNELQLKYGGINGTGYDKANNIVIDLHGLKQFGSFEGGRHPDITQLLHNHQIKLLFTPELSDQHHGILIDVDDKGVAHISGALEYVHSLFGKDANGRLTHPGILEAVIAGKDGKFTPIATHPDLDKFVPKVMDGCKYVFDQTKDWSMPPVIPIFPRKALEDYQGTGDATKNFGEKKTPIFSWSKSKKVSEDLPIRNPFKNFWGKKLKERTSIASRGQTLEKSENLPDEEDFGVEYPTKQVNYSPKHIAEIVYLANSPILPEDRGKLYGANRSQQLLYLEERVLADRIRYESAESKAQYAEIISKAYKGVDETLNKYEPENRSQMPSIDKIHLVGHYEFFSQAKRHPNSLGVCFLDSGEIFLNMNAIQKMNPDQINEAILSTLTHEITHDAVTNNYWGFEAEDSDRKEYTSRRSGIQFTAKRGIDKNNMPILRTRGVALNEAVTEELGLEAYKNSTSKDYTLSIHYGPERKILKALQEKFKIDFSLFAQAAVNRRKLPALIRAMGRFTNDKGERVVNSDYVSMLMAIMDYEYERGRDYTQTMAFIKGEPTRVNEGVYKYLAPKFLNSSKSLKGETAKKYNIRVSSSY